MNGRAVTCAVPSRMDIVGSVVEAQAREQQILLAVWKRILSRTLSSNVHLWSDALPVTR